MQVPKESKHQIAGVEHLMRALLEQKNGLARRIFYKAGVDNTRLLEATDKYIQRQPKVLGESSGSTLIQRARDFMKELLADVLGESSGSILGWELEALIQRARDYMKEYGDSFVSVEHLVLAFTQDLEGKHEALDKYGKDLVAMAREGKLFPVIGRDDEIRRCIQILSRRTKNNPVLIGEPGVGRTAISEGLFQRIVQGDVPQALMNRKDFHPNRNVSVSATTETEIYNLAC
ncbi:chaperone protein ClpB3, chloroplastic-like isoform X6 [Tasmannia lanceolata]|uniref:chaperone protein ClpB3, chloroplastic-like isoform X6 n=1 Tax=Tasmannia lanceolata TaxID=3420 RepID=UPI0040634DB3